MHQSVFRRRHIPAAGPIHLAGPRPTDGGTSAATRDLLVMGYLSAVADVAQRSGVAAGTIRMGSPDSDLLHGSLDLAPIARHGRRGGSCPLTVSWDEDCGWSAELPSAGGPRFLHTACVAAPHVVSGFIADLACGRDVGMRRPVTWTTARYAHPSRTELMGELARYAVPEVCRWLGTQH